MLKKKRPYNRRNHLLTVDVMDGISLEAAAKKYSIGTKQAAQKILRLTCVNLFTHDDRKKIIDSCYDINVIRELWRESKTGYFII